MIGSLLQYARSRASLYDDGVAAFSHISSLKARCHLRSSYNMSPLTYSTLIILETQKGLVPAIRGGDRRPQRPAAFLGPHWIPPHACLLACQLACWYLALGPLGEKGKMATRQARARERAGRQVDKVDQHAQAEQSLCFLMTTILRFN